MKRSGVCPKCGCPRVMRVKSLVDANGSEAGWTPRTVLRERVRFVSPGLFSSERKERERHTGSTEAYVCTECGFIEEYLRYPATVDWGNIVDAETHTVDVAKPYR